MYGTKHILKPNDLSQFTATASFASARGSVNKELNVESKVLDGMLDSKFVVRHNKEIVYSGIYFDKAIEEYNKI